MSAALLGLLQATDRTGALAGRLDVRHWPVTVGRSLANDLVLDDSHVAADHLRISRNEDGTVSVQVLDTLNGVMLNTQQHARDEVFAWPPGQPLVLGRLKLALRLAGEPVTAEELLPRLPWKNVGWTLAALGTVLVMVLAMAWLTVADPSSLVRQLPATLAVVVFGIAIWAGGWAMATKLFTGRLYFWRHVRIACWSSLGIQAVETLAGLLAFAFSLESLARFDVQLMLLGMVVAVYLHLTVIAPHSTRRLAVGVALVAVLGSLAMLGTNWLQNKRFSNRLYMSTIYPPGWRIAPAVPVTQFLQEAGDIRQRLDRRLQDKEPDGDSPVDADTE
ncbi:MAG: FHA domain-containing protein [Pseudomonadota bacterium]